MFNGIAVDEQKYLGVILQPVLSFDEKVIKAKKNIGILKHISKSLPLKKLGQMYKALVRSHVDYFDVIYHIPSRIHRPPIDPEAESFLAYCDELNLKAYLSVKCYFILRI